MRMQQYPNSDKNNNEHTEMELLRIENQLLKQQLQRENESKYSWVQQFKTLLDKYKSLENDVAQFQSAQLEALLLSAPLVSVGSNLTNSALAVGTFPANQASHQVQLSHSMNPPTKGEFGNFSSLSTLDALLRLQSQQSVLNLGSQVTPTLGTRKRAELDSDQGLDNEAEVESLSKRSKSFAMAKLQLNNHSANTVSTISEGSANSPSFPEQHCFGSMHLNLNNSTNFTANTSVPCMLCQKKGLECCFEGRSKVCTHCKRSKKKCERFFM